MIKTTIECNNDKEMEEIILKLKLTGYTKTSDCMWAKIYAKGNNEITIIK